jgi:hypothetical protein
MPVVGDRVRIAPTKVGGAIREGVVTGVVGRLLRIKCSSGEESTVAPGPESVAVIGKVRKSAGKKVTAPAKTTSVGEEDHEEADSVSRFFPYASDLKFAPMWVVFGVRPSKDGVTITDDGLFKAKFGILHLKTPLDNVNGAHITRDYRWWTAVGPRASFVDDGLTFGTNTKAGVCVHFREKVPSALNRKGTQR